MKHTDLSDISTHWILLSDVNSLAFRGSFLIFHTQKFLGLTGVTKLKSC